MLLDRSQITIISVKSEHLAPALLWILLCILSCVITLQDKIDQKSHKWDSRDCSPVKSWYISSVKIAVLLLEVIFLVWMSSFSFCKLLQFIPVGFSVRKKTTFFMEDDQLLSCIWEGSYKKMRCLFKEFYLFTFCRPTFFLHILSSPPISHCLANSVASWAEEGVETNDNNGHFGQYVPSIPERRKLSNN